MLGFKCVIQYSITPVFRSLLGWSEAIERTKQVARRVSMAINGLRFTHVAFRASDLERSIRWYEDAFGARKVFHAKQEGDRPELLFLEFAKGQFIELFTNGKTRSAGIT